MSEIPCFTLRTVAQKCNFRASIFASLLTLFRLLSSHFELFVLLSSRFFHLQFLGLVSSSFSDSSPLVFRTSLLAFFGLLSSRFSTHFSLYTRPRPLASAPPTKSQRRFDRVKRSTKYDHVRHKDVWQSISPLYPATFV